MFYVNNKFINTLKNVKEEAKDKYPWFAQDNERRNMSDWEILDKYVHLDSEKKQVFDMLYTYKDAFSLRDEIGTCPNIEVETDVIDKSSLLY